ncbi:methylthioxylose transferase [Frankia sp. AiPs1]|uniref:hypothetical protein n=1 Tax=Frankia sp. AiPa1 TaxID=573492 RepID=UPI00202B4754|nr:hypothetical protein [Frankia sp. AiPa1]MCL9758838.1 hypothetical protein [Frankia sp. AiPa1]
MSLTEDTAGPPGSPQAGEPASTLADAAGPASPPSRSAIRAELAEAGIWLALVVFGLAGTAILTSSHLALGLREPPWHDGWRGRFDPMVVVPVAIAAAVLTLAGWWASTFRPGGPRTDAGGGLDTGAAAKADARAGHGVGSRPATAIFRLPWAVLLVLGYVASLAWTLALALVTPGGAGAGLRASPDLVAAAHAIGGDPLATLGSYTDIVPPAVAGSVDVLPAHPPGPLLAAWVLGRFGLSGAQSLGMAFTLIGALTVPVVCVAVRSLCHETAARRLIPVLALAPWGGWMAGSPDAVTALLAALAVAVGVVGCEPGRRSVWWALGSGLLLGLAALFGYVSVWLGVAVAAAYFVRRRPLLNAVTGLGALLPLWLFAAWGFSWPDGLALARVRHQTPAVTLAWVFLDLVVALLGAGPVAVRAARRLRLTPGWPFLLGAAATALFAAVATLAEGGTQRTWLPLFPWLLVPAVAPNPRPPGPGDRLRAGTLPVILMALGATAAILLHLSMAGPT